MLQRRAFPLLLLPALPRPASAQPVPEYRFRVMRDGSQIGNHRVSFSSAGDATTARIDVEIAVRLAGITVFRLTHRFAETWANDRLRLAVSRHERNGRVTEMEARAEGNALLVRGPDGAQRLPGEAAPLTWWNPGHFNRPLFDNSTGKPLRVQWSRAPAPGGGVRWTATGDTESEGVYAADGTWLGWRTVAEDGSTVVYERA
ncbi:hypothetical protein GCM10009416_09040 [Craurococcus roseus]|uniref:M1 family peptidase n=1 Tax=Craurococcus roseus TaxID=77585 RepID=A0ABP3PQ36_9PROT